MRHLLSIDDLDRDDIERICDRARSFAEVGRRDIKKVPTLRGRTIVSLFYEASTRTSSSFELAAKRLSADVVSVKSAGSSVDKGESLRDTIATLSAYEPEAIVIRSPEAGRRRARRRLDRRRRRQRRRRQARASEPGAPRRLHPDRQRRAARRQADLDRRRRRPQPRRPLLHPRLRDDGRRGDRRRPADADPARDRGARLRGRLRPRRPRRGRRHLRAADAEGADDGRASSRRCASTRSTTRSTTAGSGRASSSCTPGPVNRGVELAPEVIDGPASLITAQVAGGLLVRMAILYEILAGGERPRPLSAAGAVRRRGERRRADRGAGLSAERPEIATLDWRGAGATGGEDLLIRGAHAIDPRSGLDRECDIVVRDGPDRRDRRSRRRRASRRRRGDRRCRAARLPGLLRPPRPSADARPGVPRGHRVRHPRRRRGRLLRDRRDGEHRPGRRRPGDRRGAPRAGRGRGGRPDRLRRDRHPRHGGARADRDGGAARGRRASASPTTGCRSPTPA